MRSAVQIHLQRWSEPTLGGSVLERSQSERCQQQSDSGPGPLCGSHFWLLRVSWVECAYGAVTPAPVFCARDDWEICCAQSSLVCCVTGFTQNWFPGFFHVLLQEIRAVCHLKLSFTLPSFSFQQLSIFCPGSLSYMLSPKIIYCKYLLWLTIPNRENWTAECSEMKTIILWSRMKMLIARPFKCFDMT